MKEETSSWCSMENWPQLAYVLSDTPNSSFLVKILGWSPVTFYIVDVVPSGRIHESKCILRCRLRLPLSQYIVYDIFIYTLYVCIYIYIMYVYIHIILYVWEYIYIYVLYYMYVYIHIICMCIYIICMIYMICMYVYIYNLYVHIYIYMYVCVYIKCM